MHIGVLTLRFHLEGCASLKEKRQRLAGLRDRFGRQPGIAVCESGLQDALQQAEWSFVFASTSPPVVDGMVREVEDHIAEHVDARIVGRELGYA